MKYARERAEDDPSPSKYIKIAMFDILSEF